MSLKSFALTNKGLVRTNNEDYFLINLEKSIYLLADGMGGHRAGEVASHGACKLFDKYFTTPEENIENHLIDIFTKVNKTIINQSKNKEELKGMGATFIACYIENKHAHFCHVGDVRAYHFRDNSLTRITEDHSSVASLVKQGFITEEQAKNHPLRSRVSRAIGSDENIIPDYNIIKINKNDIILLCSDGLWNMVDNNKILKILSKDANVEIKCIELVKKANEAGGKDNITVILIEVL